MVFINETGTISIILVNATNNITGDIFLTLFGIMIIIISLFIMFKIPTIATTILILPMLLVFMSYYGDFIAVGGALIIYLGVMLAINWPSK